VKVLFLFGPNLSALGRRDPETYGTQTLEEVMGEVERHAADAGHQATWRATEHEGELGHWLLAARQDGFDAVVINPGALAHYSYALRDAVEACGLPVIEVHQSNVYAREEFRQHSVLSGVCRVVIVGAGTGGYHLALEALRWISG
jgi:3-dehydroquinate dehydratase-2